MKNLILVLFSFIFNSFVFSQISNINIIEVYWDKNQTESYNYKFDIISKGDTISPNIHKKYFFTTANLDTTVTLVVTMNNRKVVIENFKSFYLKGFGYMRFYVNPNASEKCVNTFFIAGSHFDYKKSQCNVSHEGSFVRFHNKGKNSFEEFFLSWYLKKSHLISIS